MSLNPTYQFDVVVGENTFDGVTIGWKALISKAQFPKISKLENTVQVFYLDKDKYKNSFQQFTLLFDTIPDKLFEYKAYIDEDNVVITGLTETTIRVAIVELITNLNSKFSVKMVRPPLNFRVYCDETQNYTNSSNQDNTFFDVEQLGLFSPIGDY